MHKFKVFKTRVFVAFTVPQIHRCYSTKPLMMSLSLSREFEGQLSLYVLCNNGTVHTMAVARQAASRQDYSSTRRDLGGDCVLLRVVTPGLTLASRRPAPSSAKFSGTAGTVVALGQSTSTP